MCFWALNSSEACKIGQKFLVWCKQGVPTRKIWPPSRGFNSRAFYAHVRLVVFIGELGRSEHISGNLKRVVSFKVKSMESTVEGNTTTLLEKWILSHNMTLFQLAKKLSDAIADRMKFAMIFRSKHTGFSPEFRSNPKLQTLRWLSGNRICFRFNLVSVILSPTENEAGENSQSFRWPISLKSN